MTRRTRIGLALIFVATIMKAALLAHYGVESTPEQHDLVMATTIMALIGVVTFIWDE